MAVTVRTIVVACLAIAAFDSAAQSDARTDFSGLWIFILSSYDDPAWELYDLLDCFTCVQEAKDYFEELLEDPTKRDWSAGQLRDAVIARHVEAVESKRTEEGRRIRDNYKPEDDAAVTCSPFNTFRYILYPHAFVIEQHDGYLTIRYEFGGVERTVYMDGRDHPSNLEPSLLGHSVGRIEGNTLIIDTVGVVEGEIMPLWVILNTDQARGTERYTLSEDGNRLDGEFVLDDPVLFREPVRFPGARIRAPLSDYEQTSCDAISGEL